MEEVAAPALKEMLAQAERRAWHLELRDYYAGSDAYELWRKGEPFDDSKADSEWAGLLAPLASRGGDLRRVRVVSVPVSSYVRWEHLVTPAANLAAGERVRWLSRRRTISLALPGNDLWLIDDRVLFQHFSGDGALVDTEVSVAEPTVRFTEVAFSEAWRLAVDHADFVID